MGYLELLVDLHLGGIRQGPGSDEGTLRALGLTGLTGHESVTVADIGCGTGTSALALAQNLPAENQEFDPYKKYQNWFSFGYYIAHKRG